jgi:asparagine synthase (glutamine-hydrolysing)
MFVLLAGRGAVEDELAFRRMAGALRGSTDAPRTWLDERRQSAAASLKPGFVPEDVFDAQPLVTSERVLVCQARIDNRDELLARLGLADDRELADSALLAHAYDRWGEACLGELVGDYAFAAWHRTDGHVFAAVDPLGMRRLAWTRVADGIALSAQVPALLADRRVSLEPDLRALAKVLDSGLDRSATPFAALRALPGGHRLTWSGGEPQVERWWRPEFGADLWYSDPRDYVEEARELFTGAVRAQLRSSSPISSTLSGGLDSGSVTAAAARLLSDRGAHLTAYTSVPETGLEPSQRPNWDPDDRAYAAEVAAGLPNIQHRLVAPEGRCTLDVSRTVADRSRTPIKTATNLLWADAIGATMSTCGSRVLLVGQRGNHAFSWRGQSTVWELATFGKVGAALRQARFEARARNKSLAWVLAGVARGALRTLSRRPLASDFRDSELRFIRAPFRPSRRERRNEYAMIPGERRFWAVVTTTPAHAFTPDPVLQWGVEFRDPTADRRLIERLLRFPQAAFRIGGRYRGLAREIAAGLLPDSVRLRVTQGAQVPEAPSLIALHARRYEAALAEMRRSAACRELFDLDLVGEALQGFAGGSRDYASALRLDRAFNVGLFLTGLEGPR